MHACAWIFQGNIDQARREFQTAVPLKDNGQGNVAPHIALAAIAFQQGRIDDALRLYASSSSSLHTDIFPM
jgi:tetratricopeptide (TPR) repeat protein